MIGGVRNIIFNNVTQLTISNIDIINCGSEIPSNVLKSVNQSFFSIQEGQKAVVLITQSRHVTLVNINIQMYRGFAIFIVNVFKLINFEAINIENILCPEESTTVSCSFGAVVIYFYNSASLLDKSDNETNILLNNSNISNNLNLYRPVDTCYTTDFHSAKTFPMITSAALTIIFCQSTFITNVNIQNSEFKNNYGQVAAGILTVYRNSPYTAFVHLNNNYFFQNYFLDNRDKCIGTAIRTIFSQIIDKKIEHIPPSIFTGNDTMITSHHNQTSVYISGLVLNNLYLKFSNFNCTKNFATNNGICMTVEFFKNPENFHSKYNSEVYIQFFGMCVSSNKYQYQLFLQKGLIQNALTKNPSLFTFINVQLVIFEDTSLFIDNEVSAISAFNSDIKLRGKIVFQKNTLQKTRGVVFLNSLSHLIFSEYVNVTFINNIVMYDSALIDAFITDSNTPNTQCAFQFEKINENMLNATDMYNITFIDNTFSQSKHTSELIKINPAYQCLQAYSAKKKHFNMRKLYDKIFNSSTTKIVSTPSKVYLCKNVTSSTIYPGTPIVIYVVIKDEGEQIVPANVLTQLYSDSHNKLQTELSFSPENSIKEFNHHDQCARFSYLIHSNSSSAAKGHLMLSVLHKQPTLNVPFQIQQCPIGFELEKGRCDCNTFIHAVQKKKKKFEITCNLKSIENGSSYALVMVAKLNGFWLGKGNSKTITTHANSLQMEHNTSLLVFSGICPIGSCNFSKSSVNLLENDSLCIGQRMGQLCSECKPGCSIVFGSTQCYICTNIWLLTIILYAFLGILLVIFLGLLRFTIDHGIVTSLILYGNIATFGLMDLVGVDSQYIQYESIFLSLINLNIGYPICFYNGMSETVKIALQFVFPVYVWAIVIFTVLVSHRSVSVSNWISNCSVQVLVTLVHLSYVKLLVTVINIFSFLKVFVENHSTHTLQVAYLWYSDASIPYGSTWGHVCLIILAVIFTCGFLIPYLLLSLFIPCCWRWRLVIRFRPVFDTLYGPYKHKYAYWFGVRLLLLTIFAVIFAISQGVNVYDQLPSYQIILTLFVIAQAS